MSNYLLEQLSAINDLVEDVIRENNELKKQLSPKLDNKPKLTKRDVERIRQMKRNGCTQADIAECLDVNPATVSRIVRGQYHK